MSANVTLYISGEGADLLDSLAWKAVATPSLEASGALDVLADALLERGLIEEWRRKLHAPHGFEYETPREQAWRWATMHTWMCTIETFATINPPSAQDIEAYARTREGWVEQAEWWVEPETDEALRTRVLEALRKGLGGVSSLTLAARDYLEKQAVVAMDRELEEIGRIFGLVRGDGIPRRGRQ